MTSGEEGELQVPAAAPAWDEPWPGGPVPERPRLGILHLMVWTACSALYLGITRTLEIDAQRPGASATALWALQGVSAGALWGGFVLWIALRRRRVPFPTYPGELLWVAFAILHTVRIAVYACLRATGPAYDGWPRQAVLFVAMLLWAIVYLVAARKARIAKWRACLVLLALADLGRPLLLFCLFARFPWLWHAGGALPGVILAFVAGSDVLRRRRYPWTHWAGPVIGLWLGALNGAAAIVGLLRPLVAPQG